MKEVNTQEPLSTDPHRLNLIFRCWSSYKGDLPRRQAGKSTLASPVAQHCEFAARFHRDSNFVLGSDWPSSALLAFRLRDSSCVDGVSATVLLPGTFGMADANEHEDGGVSGLITVEGGSNAASSSSFGSRNMYVPCARPFVLRHPHREKPSFPKTYTSLWNDSSRDVFGGSPKGHRTTRSQPKSSCSRKA
jgi:hypothetical protein